MHAKSYQDTGNRSGFENGAVIPLDPFFKGNGASPCLPYPAADPALRERLALRAEAFGWRRSADAGVWLEAGDGARITPEIGDENSYLFVRPPGCQAARLRSRAGQPRDTHAGSTDTRQLGVAVRQLNLQEASGAMRSVQLDNSLLWHGFFECEQDTPELRLQRWSNGKAGLPLSALASGDAVTAVKLILGEPQLLFWQAPRAVVLAMRQAAGAQPACAE